jgi:glycosyltransferase involved in cell wall biosynthesis
VPLSAAPAVVQDRPERVDALDAVTVVVPAFNEERGIAGVVQELRELGKSLGCPCEIVVVDDGSTDGTAAALEGARGTDGGGVRVLRNPENRGYGYSLKRGIREAKHPVIVITDADGTYPNDRIPELVARVRGGAAMAVGARSLASGSVPLSRKPAKWILNALANFLAGKRIPDLNSGLRAMRRDLPARFEPIIPDGFSFTTTITLAAVTNAFRVDFLPIEYAKRQGSSKIRPIRDTANFFNLVVRTVLYFRPLKVFLPLAGILLGCATGTAVRDLWQNVYVGGGNVVIGDVAVILFLAGVNVLTVGFLADLACEAWRPSGLRRRRRIYENPLAFFMWAAVLFAAIALVLHFRDRYIFDRYLQPKTLAMWVSTLQLFSTGLLADVIQRRGQLR